MRFLRSIILPILLFSLNALQAEDGYRLWLRYDRISDLAVLDKYNSTVTGWIAEGDSPVIKAAGKELNDGIDGLLGKDIPELNSVRKHGAVVAGTPESSSIIASLDIDERPVPAEYEKPEHPLDYFMKIRYRNDGRIGN